MNSMIELHKTATVGYTDQQNWIMFDLDAMSTFVAVVRLGHFAAVSRSLGLPRSTVSQRVARLETTLGVRLLERTTRALRPTNAGAAYYERCARILCEIEEANVAVKDLGTSPRGIVRVATPILFGQSVLAAIAATFSQRYPEVQVEVVASDRRVNLLEEGFDVAIVVATSEPDSTMISRVLGVGQHWCCAAPSYLSAHGTPSAPGDLSAHDCIIIDREAAADFARGARWVFERRDDVQRVDVHGRLRLNSMIMAHAAVLAGAGIATVPSFICAEDVKNGRLVRILSGWSVESRDIRVVYSSNHYLSRPVRLFIDALVMECKRYGRSDEASVGLRSQRNARARSGMRQSPGSPGTSSGRRH